MKQKTEPFFISNPPKIINNYELKDELFKISSATFYLGINKYINEKVLIKVFNKKELEKNIFYLSYINNEIFILKLLKHKNILQMLEYIESKDYVFIIFEYFDGYPLDYYLKKSKHFSEKEILNIFYELIIPMIYMHNMNICHLYINLENILVNKKGNIKLVNFYYGCFYTDKIKRDVKQQYNTFLCPEIIAKEKFVPQKADAYSCGVVLYILFIGKAPFHSGRSSITNQELIMKGNYFMPDDLKLNIKNLINKLLEYDPEERLSFIDVLNCEWFTENSITTDINDIIDGINVLRYKYPIDDKIVEICVNDYKLNKNKLIEKLNNNCFDNYTSFYKQIVVSLKHKGIKSVSDLSSDLYYRYLKEKSNLYDEDKQKELIEKYLLGEETKNQKSRQLENKSMTKLMEVSDKVNYIKKRYNRKDYKEDFVLSDEELKRLKNRDKKNSVILNENVVDIISNLQKKIIDEKIKEEPENESRSSSQSIKEKTETRKRKPTIKKKEEKEKDEKYNEDEIKAEIKTLPRKSTLKIKKNKEKKNESNIEKKVTFEIIDIDSMLGNIKKRKYSERKKIKNNNKNYDFEIIDDKKRHYSMRNKKKNKNFCIENIDIELPEPKEEKRKYSFKKMKKKDEDIIIDEKNEELIEDKNDESNDKLKNIKNNENIDKNYMNDTQENNNKNKKKTKNKKDKNRSSNELSIYLETQKITTTQDYIKKTNTTKNYYNDFSNINSLPNSLNEKKINKNNLSKKINNQNKNNKLKNNKNMEENNQQNQTAPNIENKTINETDSNNNSIKQNSSSKNIENSFKKTSYPSIPKLTPLQQLRSQTSRASEYDIMRDFKPKKNSIEMKTPRKNDKKNTVSLLYSPVTDRNEENYKSNMDYLKKRKMSGFINNLAIINNMTNNQKINYILNKKKFQNNIVKKSTFRRLSKIFPSYRNSISCVDSMDVKDFERDINDIIKDIQTKNIQTAKKLKETKGVLTKCGNYQKLTIEVDDSLTKETKDWNIFSNTETNKSQNNKKEKSKNKNNKNSKNKNLTKSQSKSPISKTIINKNKNSNYDENLFYKNGLSKQKKTNIDLEFIPIDGNDDVFERLYTNYNDYFKKHKSKNKSSKKSKKEDDDILPKDDYSNLDNKSLEVINTTSRKKKKKKRIISAIDLEDYNQGYKNEDREKQKIQCKLTKYGYVTNRNIVDKLNSQKNSFDKEEEYKKNDENYNNDTNVDFNNITSVYNNESINDSTEYKNENNNENSKNDNSISINNVNNKDFSISKTELKEKKYIQKIKGSFIHTTSNSLIKSNNYKVNEDKKLKMINMKKNLLPKVNLYKNNFLKNKISVNRLQQNNTEINNINKNFNKKNLLTKSNLDKSFDNILKNKNKIRINVITQNIKKQLIPKVGKFDSLEKNEKNKNGINISKKYERNTLEINDVKKDNGKSNNEKMRLYTGPIDIRYISIKNLKESKEHIIKVLNKQGYNCKQNKTCKMKFYKRDKIIEVEIVKLKKDYLYYLLRKKF